VGWVVMLTTRCRAGMNCSGFNILLLLNGGLR
jgi:hypothetical protein